LLSGTTIGNTAWLFADKALRMAVGLTVGVMVARYLGPTQFGLLSYALTFATFWAVLAGVGLNTVVVRELVEEPGRASFTLGTAFWLQFVAGLAAYGLCVAGIGVLRSADEVLRTLVCILGAG
jgi:PST family polysaccharide transporter